VAKLKPRADGRPHLADVLDPRRVAIVGASRNPRTLSGRFVSHLQKHGFPGEIIPINKSADEVQGVKAYPSLDAVPGGPVDCAIITVPGESALEAGISAAEAGVGLTVMFASGFAEAGASGQARQQRLIDAFSASQGRVLGPNCPGFVNGVGRVAGAVSAFVGGHEIPAGGVAIVSQSGAVGGLIAERVLDAGAGLSHVIFTGNEADVEIGEAIEAAAAEPSCKVIACFAESIRDSGALFGAIEFARSLGKPVVIVSGGRSEEARRASALHTGKVLSVGDADRAALEQAGATIADDLLELAETCVALETAPRLGGGRVGVISTTGGLGVLVADQVRDAGCTLPPLAEDAAESLREILPDYASTSNPCDFADALLSQEKLLVLASEKFADTGSFDALVITMAVHPDFVAIRLAADIVEAGRSVELPLFVYWPGGSMGLEAVAEIRQGGVPVFESAHALTLALSTIRQRPIGIESDEPASAEAPSARAEREIKQLLEAQGLAVPAGGLASSRDQVESVSEQLSAPLVLKAHRPLLDHKAGRGYVRRGVLGPEQAVLIWDQFEAIAEREGIALEEVLVEEQAAEIGPELLISCQRTSRGFETLASAGGAVAEMKVARGLGFGRLDDAGIEAMAEQIDLDQRFRRSFTAAVRAIQTVAQSYGPGLEVLEVNPVLLTPERCLALDAKVRLAVD